MLKGHFKYALALDVETTGLSYNCVEGYGPAQCHQAISFGLAVVDADTLQVIDKLYIELKYNGIDQWDTKAESIHGLSREYLEANGVDEQVAASTIVEFLLKYWQPYNGRINIRLIGHNVATFDLFFIKRLLDKFGFKGLVNFGSRHIDTSTIGFVCFQTYTSDQLFDLIGVTRDDHSHNALDDALASVKVVQMARRLMTVACEKGEKV